MLKLPYTMRLRYCASFTSFLLLVFLLFACRNEPKLPVVAADTEVVMRTTSDPTGLNYLIDYRGDARLMIRLLSVPLLDFNPTTYQLEPALAKSLPIKKEITEGEYAGLMSYTFEILEEAVWDDGAPITAKDAMFTLKAAYNPNYSSPYASQFNRIAKMEVDPNNLKKFTVIYDKYIIAESSIGTFELMPAHLLDPNSVYEKFDLEAFRNPANKEKITNDESLKAVGDLFTTPDNTGHSGKMSGSGPYQLTSWVTGQELVFEKKENWWGDQLVANAHLEAKPKKIIFKIVPDFSATMSLMRNGEIDVVKAVPYAEYDRMLKDEYYKENFNFYEPSMFRHAFFLMNNNDLKLQDKRVRRALAHLCDLEDIGETVFYGRKNFASTPIHPSKSYYRKDLPIIQYNVEKAKNLLKEAGWADSNNNGILDKIIDGSLQELNLKYSYVGRSSTQENLGQVLKESAKPAGVNIELVPQDMRPLMQSQKQKKYELSVTSSGWYPFHKDMYERWHTNGGINHMAFGNAETDALIEELQKTVDEDKLAELFSKIQEIIYEEQPVIIVNVGTERIVAKKKFGKITTTSISPGFLLNEFSESLVPAEIDNN